MNRNLTYAIDPSSEQLLRTLLESAGYSFSPAPYAFWRASDGHTTLTFYHSGRFLIQGQSPEGAATLLVDAGVLTDTDMAERTQQAAPQPKPAIDPSFPTWIGTDESGKGDYFGPLTVAGVLATSDTAKQLLRMGVRDSKQLSDTAIKTLAPQIRTLCPHSVAVITPREYNDLYPRMGNLNRLLAWGHARVIEVILSNHTCDHAITDKFGDQKHLKAALMEKGRQITLIQREHAEDDPAVASASILAREAFLQGLESLSLKYRIELPKGASQRGIEVGRQFAASEGKAKLKEVAKLHFATTQQVLDSKPQPAVCEFNDTEIMNYLHKNGF